MNIDVIKKARDTIANGYWHQGSGRSAYFPERVCAVTALYEASAELSLNDIEKVVQFVDEFAPPRTKGLLALRPLARFNDDPKTTRQDVVDVFDKALAELGGLG